MKGLIKYLLMTLGAALHRDCKPKVVFYHDIGKKWTPMGTDVEVFLAHMQCLRAGDVVCFDDGFRGVWDHREQLAGIREQGTGNREQGMSGNREQLRVIVFLAVGLVGCHGYLTWEEIRELQDKYGIEFQCHTWSHQTLIGPWNAEVAIPEEGRTEVWYRHELVDSKAELERQLGRPITALCFPVGYFSDEVIRRCQAAGYTKVYASYPGNVTDEYVQPRCLVQDLPVGAFKTVLNGGMGMLVKRYKRMHIF